MSVPTRPMDAFGATPRAHFSWIVLLTLASIALSWSGIDYQLPHVAQFDETVYHAQYRAFVESDAVPEARRYFNAYPTAFARAAAAIPRGRSAGTITGLDHHLAEAASDFVFIRRCVAVLAALIVPATWLLARRFMSSAWSLVAAGLASTSVLFYSFATQGRPHALITVAIVFAVAASIDVARKRTLGASFVAGLACGLATALLHSGVATAVPLGVAHALQLRRDGKRALFRFAAALVPFVTIFLLSNPAFLPKLLSAESEQGGAAFLLSHDAGWGRFRGGGASVVLRAFAYYDPLLWLVALVALGAGAVIGVLRRNAFSGERPELLVVLAFFVPYLVALVLFEDTHYRFALPLFPFAALFAALFVSAIPRLGAWLAGAMLAAQLLCVLQVARLHRAPDTYEQASAWIETHADRRSTRISISPWLELPLLRTRAALDAHGVSAAGDVAHWLDYQRALPPETLDELGWSIVDLPLRRAAQRRAFADDPQLFLRDLNADYVVLEVFDGAERPLMDAIRAAARETGRLEARFTPQATETSAGYPIEPYVSGELWEGNRFVFQMWSARSLGYCIEIYRLAAR